MRRVLLGGSILGSVLLAANTTQAQSTPPAPPQSTSPEAVTTTGPIAKPSEIAAGPTSAAAVDLKRRGVNEVEGVVVTGSRIRRYDLTSVQPVQVIGAQYLTNKGITNVADVLNQLPGAGVGITPNGAQGSFGTGRNYLNLFNLGSQRTLTLVNGKRFIGANAASNFSGANPGGQVDLNSLPTGFLDRVEEVPATGAAVYGSDAIAGVVNIIYKDKFVGESFDAQYGISERNDYPKYHLQAAVGQNFLNDRLNLAVDFEYDRTNPLLYTQRPQTAAQYAFAANRYGAVLNGVTPASLLISGRTIPETTPGGIVFVRNTSNLAGLATVANPAGGRIAAQFAPDGTLVPYDTGTFYQTSISAGGQGLSLAPLTALETPLDRKLINGLGSFEISPHVRLHGAFFYTRDDSTEPARQPIYNAPLFGGTSGSIPFTLSNPFLTPQAVAALKGQSTNGTYYLSRASTDIVGSGAIVSQSTDIDGQLNLEGDFRLFDRDFTWNIGGTRGRSEGYFISPGVNEANFLNAIDPVLSNGQIVCRSTLTNPGNGCAPLNLFGQGAPSKAALAYVTVPFRSDFQSDQTDGQANLSGTVVKLPAGNWGFNIGYEYRKEEAKFLPDANSRAGIGRSVPISPLNGKFDTNEYYIESLLPVLGPGFNFPLAYKLEFEGAFRHVDNSLAGANDSYSYGVRYSPIKDVTFRGSRSNTFRAPSLVELFLPTSTIFTTATDPCDQSQLSAGNNPAARLKNCQAQFAAVGLPTNYKLNSNIQAATIMGTTGGNSKLQNEVGDSWTYGMVLQPRFVPGLAVTADFVHIDVTNAISNFGATSILSTCYDSNVYPSAACGRFTRDANGQVTAISTGYINAGYFRFEGQTFNLSYDRDIARLPLVHTDLVLGRASVNFNVGHTTRFKNSVSGTGFDLVDSEGTIGFPRWKYQIDLGYNLGGFGSTFTTHFISSSLYNRTFTTLNQSVLKVGDYYTYDLALRYTIPKTGVTLRMGVNNLTNKVPPFPAVGIGTYDQIGRYYFFGVNGRF